MTCWHSSQDREENSKENSEVLVLCSFHSTDGAYTEAKYPELSDTVMKNCNR